MAKTIKKLTQENTQLKAGSMAQSKLISSLEHELTNKDSERADIVNEASMYKAWSWRLLSRAFGLSAQDLTAMTDKQIEAKVIEYEDAEHTYTQMKKRANAEIARVSDLKVAARKRLKDGTSTNAEADLKLIELVVAPEKK